MNKLLERFQVHPVIGLAAILIVLRLPVAFMANQGLIENIDELTMTFNTADRFLGVPHVTASWPGGTVQLITVPLIALQYIIQTNVHISANTLVAFFSDLYRNPWPAIALTRAPIVIVSSLGIAMLYYPLAAVAKKANIIFMSILMVATLPFVWVHSQMATTDGMALGLVCASAGVLGRPKTQARVQIAGALFGLALAAKVLYVLAIPILISLLIINTTSIKRDFVYFISFAVIGFVFACPYVWTDPIRYAKGLFGTSAKQGRPPNFQQLLAILFSSYTWPLMALYALGLADLLRKHKYAISIGVILTLLLSLVIFSRTQGYVFDRYFLPSWIGFAFGVTAGFNALAKCLTQITHAQRSSWPLWLITGLVLVPVVISNTASYASTIKISHDNQLELWRLVKDVKGMNCRRDIIIQAPMLPYFSNFASNQSLEDIREEMDLVNSGKRIEIISKIATKSIDPLWISYLGSNFNAQEQAWDARLRLMQYKEPINHVNIKLWDPFTNYAERFGYYTNPELKDVLDSGDFCTFVSDGRFATELGIQGESYGGYSLVRGNVEGQVNPRRLRK